MKQFTIFMSLLLSGIFIALAGAIHFFVILSRQIQGCHPCWWMVDLAAVFVGVFLFALSMRYDMEYDVT